MIYLKAPDKESFDQAVIDAGWSEEVFVPGDIDGDNDTTETRLACYTTTHSLDVIGTIYRETGNMITVSETSDYPASEYAETEAVDGYHANLLLHGEDMPEALAGFVIEAPTAPVRRFA